MLHTDSVHYLENAGFHYKSADSPELWTMLEGHFAGPRPIGSKFSSMPASFVAELISMGEEALLEAMVNHHRKTGTIGRVTRVIDLPYIIGTEATIPLELADSHQLLRLIEHPGTLRERLIHVVPTVADQIPITSHMTATGGLYADGHTAGYYDLCPGEHVGGEKVGPQQSCAHLATDREIEALALEMEAKIEDIMIVTRKECEDILKRARRAFA